MERPRLVTDGPDEPHRVPGPQGSDDVTEPLRRLVGRSIESIHLDDDMAAANRVGPPGHLSVDLNGRSRLAARSRKYVIVRPLVRLEDEPTGGRLAPDRPHPGRPGLGIRPADSEQERAGRMPG